MIKTYQILIQELSEYKNKKTKIQRMVKNGELVPITKGLYETDKSVNPYFLANAIYSPSYISFETALAYYNLIPEAVYMIKNATFGKNKKKEYKTVFGVYSYQDIPKEAFPYGTKCVSFGEYTYYIATKEKALLDQLYSTSPILNMKEMREYLFENMRINDIELDSFDIDFISSLSKLYHSKNVELFERMLKRGKIYD